jgi:hypothetical protein
MTDPLAAYQAMTAKARKQVLLAEYRCRRKGCLLVHIWSTKGRRYYYLPRYRLTAAVAEAETIESARKKNTEDGYRKWRARAASLDNLFDFIDSDSDDVRDENRRTIGLPVNCEHVRGAITCRRLAADIDGVRPGAPRIAIFLPDEADDTPKGEHTHMFD